MRELTDHIEYLLRVNDCVIVPGWGAFIARYTPASFVAGGTRAEPPSRAIGFNGALTFSDGLLEGSVMRGEGCPYAAAAAMVRESVASFRSQLEHGGELAIGRLGIFSKTGDGELLFSPFEPLSVPGVYYGLGGFSMRPLSALRSAQEAVQEVEGDAAEHRPAPAPRVNLVPRVKRYARVAASVAALIVLAFVLSTPLPVDKSAHDYAAISDSFQPRRAASSAAGGVVAEEPAGVAGDILEEVAADAPSPFADGRYCLVVASGSTMREATRYISRQGDSGREFRVLESQGRYRVYVASGGDYRSLDETRAGLLASFPDAWICTR